MAAQACLGKRVDTEQMQGLAVEARVAFDHRGRHAHAKFRAQAHIQPLIKAAGSADDLVGGAARDGFARQREGARGSVVRDIDGYDHRNAEGNADDGKEKLPGVTRKMPGGGRTDQPAHHTTSAVCACRWPSSSVSTRSAKRVTSFE